MKQQIAPLLAKVAGFSLHAATVCEAHQRGRLERLCRYITQPPIATKRLSTDGRGRVVYRYQHPFRDGSTHVVLEPLDVMFGTNGMPRAQGCAGAAIARLVALVPRPRLNLTRFHGIFAPNFKHRNRIVPHHAHGRVDCDTPLAPMSWAQCLKRVFRIDIETCPHCGGKRRVIACIEDPPLIRRILMHIQRRDTPLNRGACAFTRPHGPFRHLHRTPQSVFCDEPPSAKSDPNTQQCRL